jgi:AcrR family transcriptional regulator
MTDIADRYNKNPCEKKSNVRDLILERASKIFLKFGFKKTTMDEIASLLHKSKTSLYYYFKGKEEIFKSIVKKKKAG